MPSETKPTERGYLRQAPRERLNTLRWVTSSLLITGGILFYFLIGIDGSVEVLPAIFLLVTFLVALWKIPLAWRRWTCAAHPELALLPVRKWCEFHPSWRVRAYRTPAGLRLLATHAAFDPRGDDTAAFFALVDADPIYSLMCQKQACFRARVSPKPWRIGIGTHIGWGTWPVIKEHSLLRRTAWVEAYEAKSTDFAA